MKTDRFSDLIRRKLESIRPEFTEKDWTRMQSTLQQAAVPQPGSSGTGQPFSGGVWAGKSWLLAAAAVSTIVLVAFSIWQRTEINHLRQTIGELKQKPVPAQVAPTTSPERERPTVAQADGSNGSALNHESLPAPTQNKEFSGRRDTVYVNRYVAAPSRSRSEVTEVQSGQSTEFPPEQRDAATSRAPVSAGSLRQQTTLNKNQKTNPYGVSSTSLPVDVDKNIANPLVTTNKAANQPGRNADEDPARKDGETRRPPTDQTNEINSQKTIAVDKTRKGEVTPNGSVSNQTNTIADKTPEQTEQKKTGQPVETGASTTYELATSRPLSTKSVNWNVLMAQRAKRMKPTQAPSVVEQPQAPASQPVRQLATRFRAGVGGEVASSLWSAGVFTEVLVGNHWTVGVGVAQATYSNRFTTDEDFNDRTHRDFRKEFGPGIEPVRDIVNIDTRQTRLQLPLSLGYRIPLSQTLTLLPTVGTYLNLTNSENVTFYCRLPQPPFQQIQRGFDHIDIRKNPSIDLINSLSLGAGLEWHSGHWALQTSPVLNIPLQIDSKMMQSDLNWQKSTTVSLRARLFYQF